jgi:hypothetical protein
MFRRGKRRGFRVRKGERGGFRVRSLGLERERELLYEQPDLRYSQK